MQRFFAHPMTIGVAVGLLVCTLFTPALRPACAAASPPPTPGVDAPADQWRDTLDEIWHPLWEISPADTGPLLELALPATTLGTNVVFAGADAAAIDTIVAEPADLGPQTWEAARRMVAAERPAEAEAVVPDVELCLVCCVALGADGSGIPFWAVGMDFGAGEALTGAYLLPIAVAPWDDIAAIDLANAWASGEDLSLTTKPGRPAGYIPKQLGCGNCICADGTSMSMDPTFCAIMDVVRSDFAECVHDATTLLTHCLGPLMAGAALVLLSCLALITISPTAVLMCVSLVLGVWLELSAACYGVYRLTLGSCHETLEDQQDLACKIACGDVVLPSSLPR